MLQLVLHNGLEPISNFLQLELEYLIQKLLSLLDLLIGLASGNKDETIPYLLDASIHGDSRLGLQFLFFLLGPLSKELFHHIFEHHPEHRIADYLFG